MSDDPQARAAEILRRAEELVPVLAERAAGTEALRRLPDETRSPTSGRPDCTRWASRGGSAAPNCRSMRSSKSSPRWPAAAPRPPGCAASTADHAMIVGMMDPRVADEIWTNDPDALIATGLFPFRHQRARRRRVAAHRPLGFRERLRLRELGVPGQHRRGRGRDRRNPIFAWCRSGRGRDRRRLAGDGARRDGIEDPRRRRGVRAAPPHDPAQAGRAAAGKRAASPDVPPLYRLPHVCTIPFHFCATALGDRGEACWKTSSPKSGSGTRFGAPVAEYATMQMRVAAASVELDCARMLIERDTREAMEAMREGRSLTLGRARTQPPRHGLCRPVLPPRRRGAVRGGRGEERLFGQHPATQVPRRPGGGEPHHPQMGRRGNHLRPRRLRPRPRLAVYLSAPALVGSVLPVILPSWSACADHDE